MSKKTTETVVSDSVADTQQPSYIEDLLKNGTAILTASSREELAEMVDNIPAECHYGAGAVCKDRETGVFSLRLDITNP